MSYKYLLHKVLSKVYPLSGYEAEQLVATKILNRRGSEKYSVIGIGLRAEEVILEEVESFTAPGTVEQWEGYWAKVVASYYAENLSALVGTLIDKVRTGLSTELHAYEACIKVDHHPFRPDVWALYWGINADGSIYAEGDGKTKEVRYLVAQSEHDFNCYVTGRTDYDYMLVEEYYFTDFDTGLQTMNIRGHEDTVYYVVPGGVDTNVFRYIIKNNLQWELLL